MTRRPFLVVLTAAVAAALTGCGLLGPAGDTAAPAAPSATAPAAPSATGPAAPSPTGPAAFGDSGKGGGEIPDPCTLLGEARVEELTGRGITRIDEDGAEAGDPMRFCQWQQPGGQLAVFLARTTPAQFDAKIAGGEPVDGVGEEAFGLAGHLYVRHGTVQIDVYARGGSDAENLATAKKVADVLLPQI